MRQQFDLLITDFYDQINRNQLKPSFQIRNREQHSLDGMHMGQLSESNKTELKVKELQAQVNDLKDLVNTLLSVICEEPDGVESELLLLLVKTR